MACGLCVLLLVSAAATAAQPTADARSGEPLITGEIVVQQDDGTNNTTQHEDPDTVDERGDSAAVASWLRSALSSRLGNSTLQLSNGQYEQAKSVLGDEYSDSLGKLVDVAGETDDAGGNNGDVGDTPVTTALNETRTTQQTFIEAVQSFQETQAAYENAKQRGNETQARALARTVQQQATRIEALSNRLSNGYHRLENTTNRSFNRPIQRIETVTANVNNTSQRVVAAEFVKTRIRVSRPTANTSFTDPVTLTGRLQTPTGQRVPNGTVTLRIGDRTLEPVLGDDGRFTVQYRPVTAAVGQQQVTVEYVPRTDSVFLGAATNTTVVVTPVTPAIAVEVGREQLRFGQSANVTGRVTVNGTGVPGLPLAVRVGTVRVGTVTTTSDGGFRYADTIPATVSLGQQAVTATVALDDRAIRATTGRATVTVAETATTLSVRGDWRADSVSITGRLTTGTGTPVPNQPVRLRQNGTQLTTVRTAENGRYTATVNAAAFDSAGAQNVTALYAPEDGNLANASASVRLNPPTASGGGGSTAATSRLVPGLPSDSELWGLIGAVLLVAGVAGVYWRRRQTPVDNGDSTTATPPTAVQSDGGGVDAPRASSDQLASASAALDADDDPEHVIQLAYLAARQALADDSDSDSNSGTHWEFYHAHADVTSRPDDLRALTTAYERTKYGPGTVTAEEATEAVAAARRLLERSDVT